MSKAFILIAEDDPDTREYLSLLLRLEGFDVATAEDGARALQSLAQTPPDLLLTDLMMPQVDGLELIRRVRQQREFADLPIVAMSAYGLSRISEAQAAGATATIRKPLDIENLISTISQVLAG